MKHAMALFASWFLISLTSLGQLVSAQENADLGKLIQGNTEFAIYLYARIRTKEGNLFLSPYSISTALAMTYGGARGKTAKQMVDALHFPLEDEKLHSSFAEIRTKLKAIQQKQKIQISIANSLWPQDKYPFLKEYLDLAKNFYQTEITPVDYETNIETARLKINAWVERETNNTIKDMFPVSPPLLNPDTVLVLVNAIYFKGQWDSQFQASATTSMPFSSEKNSPIMVSMMNQTHDFKYGEDDISQVLVMPYAGNDLSMIIFLPKEMDNLRSVEDILTEPRLTEWSKSTYKRPVNVYLPKFKITSAFDLKEVLIGMGMKDAFVWGKANFSGMDGIPYYLRLYFVMHKAFIEVNEEGTEAAAATAVGCFPSGTEVLTDGGLRSIETVDPGTKVYACDLATGAWILANILKHHSLQYEGDMITIMIGHDSIRSTGNQPFYVLRGDQLASRPLPQDVPKEEQRANKLGRWVEARDLKEGDMLQNKSGESLIITGLSSLHEKTQVHWLEVERYHNCAVHRLGILAHNQKRGIKESPIVFRADHPFLFLIRDNLTRSVLFMGRVSNPLKE
jgi:serpin B